MPFNPAPSLWIGTSYAADATDISVPIATFDELTAAEADETTGDIRKLVFALCDHLYQKWLATDSADRPARMTIFRSTNVNEATGEMTRSFTFQFLTGVTGEEVVDE
jgi:hypothetical protein